MACQQVIVRDTFKAEEEDTIGEWEIIDFGNGEPVLIVSYALDEGEDLVATIGNKPVVVMEDVSKDDEEPEAMIGDEPAVILEDALKEHEDLEGLEKELNDALGNHSAEITKDLLKDFDDFAGRVRVDSVLGNEEGLLVLQSATALHSTSRPPNRSSWRGSFVAIVAVIICSSISLVHMQRMMWACSDINHTEHLPFESGPLPHFWPKVHDAVLPGVNASSRALALWKPANSPFNSWMSTSSHAAMPAPTVRAERRPSWLLAIDELLEMGAYQHRFSVGHLLLAASLDVTNVVRQLSFQPPDAEYDLLSEGLCPWYSRSTTVAICSFCIRGSVISCASDVLVSSDEVAKIMCPGDAAQHCISALEGGVPTFNEVVTIPWPPMKQPCASVGAYSQKLAVYTAPSYPAPNTMPITNRECANIFSGHSVPKPLQRDRAAHSASFVLGVDVSGPSERLQIAPPQAQNVLSAEVPLLRAEAASGGAPASTAMRALVPMPHAAAPHAKALVPIAKLRNLWPCIAPTARGADTDAVRAHATQALGASGWRRPLRHRTACRNSTNLEGTGACFWTRTYASDSGTASRGKTTNMVARRFLLVRSSHKSGVRSA